ncbi:MAG: hypothetical protein ACLRSY_00090 [Acutalibacter sp.]
MIPWWARSRPSSLKTVTETADRIIAEAGVDLIQGRHHDRDSSRRLTADKIGKGRVSFGTNDLTR